MAIPWKMDDEELVAETPENYNFLRFLADHEPQLQASSIPTVFWQSTFRKLRDEVFDAGTYFSIRQVQYVDEDSDNEDQNLNDSLAIKCYDWEVFASYKDGISPDNPDHIFLIDHAWTYKLRDARSNLENIPGLLERMAALMDISNNNLSKEEIIETVLQEMWRYNLTYSLKERQDDDEPALPVWYILDEFGSRIQHSDDPNFRLVPFYYIPRHMLYSLLFPINKVDYEGDVTRNYVEGPPSDDLTYQARKLPWKPADFTDIDCNHLETDQDFINGGRIEESIPDNDANEPSPLIKDKLKVFTQYHYIERYLTHNRFQISDSMEGADILWLNYHFKKYKELREESPHTLINQFPCEHILTVKDLLAEICRRKASNEKTVNMDTLETYPQWLPTTYNLITELPKFVSYFQHRENRGLDNHWICKPWNLARSLDTYITDNLNHIIRLRETGPKIACKYIADPVLFPRERIGMVKFDIRYILLLRSINPLKAYAYKRFWLRFSNRPFALDQFDDYEKHFTVMNYVQTDLKQMFCEDFIEQFEAHYPLHKWKKIEADIFAMFKQVFEAAVAKKPPCGLHNNSQSRAMYAADLMLEWDRKDQDYVRMQPKLLEINWVPDCQRACEYYPEFFNDVFSVLFLDETDGKHVHLL